MGNTSTTRVLVDRALAEQGTTLEAFLDDRRAEGKAIRNIAPDLEAATGIPVPWRTLYRWANNAKKVS